MRASPEQKRIYDFIDNRYGSAIINAVAGAGKTSTLIECANRLSQNPKLYMLFCAFNTSISLEIKEKTKTIDNLRVHTIHSLGLKLLREAGLTTTVEDEDERPEGYEDENEQTKDTADRNKYKKLLQAPEVWDDILPYAAGLEDEKKEGDNEEEKTYNQFQSDLLRICEKYRISIPEDSLDAFAQMLEHYKSTLKYKEFAIEQYYHAAKVLLDKGVEVLQKKHVYDYADMLYMPIRLNLQTSFRFPVVFIDECQDLSRAQIEIVKKYCMDNARVIAVGDPYQSIYGFNGADDQSFEHVKEEFRITRELPLSHTFRCPQSVVRHVKRNFEMEFNGAKEVRGKCMEIAREDAVKIVQASDLVLARDRRSLINFAFDLIREKKEFYIRKEDADKITDELRAPFKSKKQLRQKLTAPIIRRMLESVEGQANDSTKKETIKALEMLKDLIENDWKVNSGEELIDKIKEFIKEKKEVDGAKDKKPIVLSTIHSAKGLEEKNVFLLNYEYLGESKEERQAWENQQEQNLKYVGITRAKEALYMVTNNPYTDLLEEDPEEITGQEWYRQALDQPEWKERREEIKQTDNYTCQCCGASTDEAEEVETYELVFHSGETCNVSIRIDTEVLLDKYYNHREVRIEVEDWAFIKLKNYPKVLYITPDLLVFYTMWDTIEEAERHFAKQEELYNFQFNDACTWGIGVKKTRFYTIDLPIVSIREQKPKCYLPETVLHVHHKYYISNLSPWEYGDEGLITLCQKCHERLHKKLPIPVFKRDFWWLAEIPHEHVALTPCETCHGTGHVYGLPHNSKNYCPVCNGAGYVELAPGYEEQMEYDILRRAGFGYRCFADMMGFTIYK